MRCLEAPPSSVAESWRSWTSKKKLRWARLWFSVIDNSASNLVSGTSASSVSIHYTLALALCQDSKKNKLSRTNSQASDQMMTFTPPISSFPRTLSSHTSGARQNRAEKRWARIFDTIGFPNHQGTLPCTLKYFIVKLYLSRRSAGHCCVQSDRNTR